MRLLIQVQLIAAYHSKHTTADKMRMPVIQVPYKQAVVQGPTAGAEGAWEGAGALRLAASQPASSNIAAATTSGAKRMPTVSCRVRAHAAAAREPASCPEATAGQWCLQGCRPARVMRCDSAIWPAARRSEAARIWSRASSQGQMLRPEAECSGEGVSIPHVAPAPRNLQVLHE